MAIEKVRKFFENSGIGDIILEFDMSSATVELAAQAVGCEPERIAKTLSFLVSGIPVLIVAAGDCKVDNRRFKDFFHEKARMISGGDVEALVGHAPGGVCPFAVNEGVRVYLDESLKRFTTVFPAAGSSNSAVEFTCDELEKYAKPVGWIDVCKGWRDEEKE